MRSLFQDSVEIHLSPQKGRSLRMRRIILLLSILSIGIVTLKAQTADERLVDRTKPIEKEVNDLLNQIRNSGKNKSYVDVARCYQRIGRLFQEHTLYGFAIATYAEALEYERLSHSNSYVTYRRIALCLFDMAAYDDCMKYLEKAKNAANGNFEREVEITAMEAINACAQRDRKVATRNMQLLEQYYRSSSVWSNAVNSSYHLAQFYYKGFILGEWEQALKERQKVTVGNAPLRRTLEMGQAYTALKDTANAVKYYTEYEQQLTQLRKVDLSPLFDQYTNILDYRKVDLENEAIANEADKLSLQQAQEKQRLAEIARSNMELRLQQEEDNNRLNREELQLQNRNWRQQRKEHTLKKRLQRQHEEANELAGEVNRMIISYGIALGLLFLLLMGAYTLFEMYRSAKIKKERDKAIRAEQMKSLFFQNMNHEIRTPLNAIAGFNELLHGEMADSLSEEEKQEMTDLIESNANMLVTLVNDVLDISNFESGSYTLHYSQVNIHQLCHRVLESIKSRVAPGVQIHYEPDQNREYLLYTDEERLAQVLTNYLTNACKYTEKGHITLGYILRDRSVLFSVTDTGRGIPKGEEDAVFQRFHMVANSKKGIGMGLHICHMIAQLVHGSVYVDTAYKGGARFCFEHPVTSPKA
jgi:signal transduction histidine kinase